MKYDAIFTDKPCSSAKRSRPRPETRPEIYSDQIHPGIGNIDPLTIYPLSRGSSDVTHTTVSGID